MCMLNVTQCLLFVCFVSSELRSENKLSSVGNNCSSYSFVYVLNHLGFPKSLQCVCAQFVIDLGKSDPLFK